MPNDQQNSADQVPVSFIPLASVSGVETAAPATRNIEARLAGKRGRAYWRSLQELAGTPELREYLNKEFAHGAPREWAPLKRRDFVRLMGATLALAGAGGCAYQDPEKIVPYVDQPETLVPGKPLYYATAYTRGGYAMGLLGESQMGRPVKLEGNPDHPASLGATDAMAQGSLLDLYDPDRSQTVRHLGGVASWDTFAGTMADAGGVLDNVRRTHGAGLRILCETITSPTLTAQLRRLLKKYPSAKVCQFDPVGRDSVRQGTQLTFGRELNPVYHLGPARPISAAARPAAAGPVATRILSLDSDFLWEEPGSVRYAREFASARRLRESTQSMNRLYVVESTPTITGANADHRVAVPPGAVDAVASAVAAKLGVGGATAPASLPAGLNHQWIDAVAEDLLSAAGSALVIPGAYQTPRVHALAHAMNAKLGAIGKTVTYLPPVESRFPGQELSLKDLAAEMNGSKVTALVILSGNPAYSAPAELQFRDALRAVNSTAGGQTIHLGCYEDETGVECIWHLPESHYLESWGDARAYDGTASLIQPLITPLYDTRSAIELVALLLGEGKTGLEIVREYWQSTNPAWASRPLGPGSVASGTPAAGPIAAPPAFESFWHGALTSGTVPVPAPDAVIPSATGNLGAAPAAPAAGYQVVFRPDPHIWDGRYNNNAWLQELPRPLTTLTWDNGALISPKTAKALGIVASETDAKAMAHAQGQYIELNNPVVVAPSPASNVHAETKGPVAGTLKVPVWITPGQPDETITLHLGWGRTRPGNVGAGTGFDANLLRTWASPWMAAGIQAKKVGGTYLLVNAQHHFDQEGRRIIRGGSFEELQHDPTAFAKEIAEEDERNPPTLYLREWPSDRGGEPQGEGAEPETGPGAAPRKDAGSWDTKKWGNSYNPAQGQESHIPAWGMVIDLTACIGCNSCSIACQAENNIATVGKELVYMHRQMHWIRIDQYFSGPIEDPRPDFQPVPCMHCENAPCEPVCPVEATSHSAEGINEMTYNRCIGTRYCQNNCPYKVRRFNFLQYADQKTPTIQMMRNPDVTVRSRGVMEKCTYCVQRINEARFQAEKEDRPIRDGEVLPACAQVCPTEAIVFGDLNDQSSRARKLKEHPLEYGLLTELNTRPRTSYMARVRNPNPKLPEGAGSGIVWKGDF